MLPEYHLYVVADGMGGHLGGERASQLAIESIQELVEEHHEHVNSDHAAQLLGDSLKLASKKIHEESMSKEELKGMGTTATACLLNGEQAIFAHVGDSRAYLVRGSEIRQVSEDHSLVQEQYKAGLISREQTKYSKFRNIITRCLGFEDNVVVDVTAIPAQPGDVFVLCTDGLTTLVEDQEILETVKDLEPEKAGQRLIDMANHRGGHDNITVLLVYV